MNFKQLVFCFQDSPLLSLLGQTSSVSWHLVDLVSYQSVLGYFSSHYPPSVILAEDCASDLVVKLLKVSAGLSLPADSRKHVVSWKSSLKVEALFRIRSQICASMGSHASCEFLGRES